MENYERLIYDTIPGDTPRAKYERLTECLRLLQQIGWPRRGTEEESWDIYTAGDKARELVSNEPSYTVPNAEVDAPSGARSAERR